MTWSVEGAFESHTRDDQDVGGTGLHPFIRNTIKAAWLIKCPQCGKEARRNTKQGVIRAAQAEGFDD